jgi:Protein of unknown function (DUF3078)
MKSLISIAFFGLLISLSALAQTPASAKDSLAAKPDTLDGLAAKPDMSDSLAVKPDADAPDDSLAVKFDTVNVVVKADTSYWQRSFSGGINFNQAAFSNWSGGGVNSTALGMVVAGRALYEKEAWSWDNTANLQLGYTTQNGLSRKSSDQIQLNSVVGRKLSPHWDLIGTGSFTTFFAPGYRYDKLGPNETQFAVSNFLAPGQLLFALGFAYKPNDWFALRLNPISTRFTFLADQGVRYRETGTTLIRDATQAAYGVQPGQSVRTEILAFSLQAAVNRQIAQNVGLTLNYQLFANYTALDNINHRVDLILTAKINKYLSTTFGLIALYNKDFSDNLQIQQTLAVGLVYSMSTFRKK